MLGLCGSFEEKVLEELSFCYFKMVKVLIGAVHAKTSSYSTTDDGSAPIGAAYFKCLGLPYNNELKKIWQIIPHVVRYHEIY
jgi:hypothetical protein